MHLAGIPSHSGVKDVPIALQSIVKFTVPDTEFAPIKEETHEDEEDGTLELTQTTNRTSSEMTFSKR